MEQNYKQKFYDTYADEVLPFTFQIDFARIRRVRIFYILLFLSILLFCVLVCCYAFINVNLKIKIALLLSYFLSLYICVRYLIYAGRKFKNSLKDKFLAVLPPLFGDIRWNNELLTKVLYYAKSDVFKSHNIVQCEDIFDVTYKGVNFVLARTQLKRTDSDISSKISFTVFNGLIIAFDCNRTFEGKTLVTLKKNKLFKIKSKQLNFNISSTDEQEAKMLVTDEFLQCLQNLRAVYGSDNLKCYFNDDKIIFAISTRKKLFEKGYLFNSLNSPKNIYRFCDEILAIYDIIEYFKANEKIGL